VGAQSAAAGASDGELLRRYHEELRARHYSADPAQLEAVRHLDELRTRLLAAGRSPAARLLARLRGMPAAAAPRGLYLWGGVGRGKTWLMDLFYASLPFPQRRRRHFHRFMHEVHAELAQLRARRSPLQFIAARFARTARVLCFDELYVSDIADAMILGGLFEGLIAHGVTLVATSNVPPGELYRDGLQRQRFLPAIALLEAHCEVLQVAGATDYRLRQLTAAGTYLSTAAPDTPARLAALFDELAGAPAQRGGSIRIEARPIAVVRAGPGALWCEFPALCAGARSQEDYIEIAREYQAVILSGVPLLTAELEDEARRFVALVDELYDRNVKLVVSAAAAPAQLYSGSRVREVFARTVSRLTEMQSGEYLAREHRP